MMSYTIEASIHVGNTEMGAYPKTRTLNKFQVKKWINDMLARFTASYKQVTEEKLSKYVNELVEQLQKEGVDWDSVVRVRLTPQLSFVVVMVDCIDNYSDHPSVKTTYSCPLRKPFLSITDAGIDTTTDSETK